MIMIMIICNVFVSAIVDIHVEHWIHNITNTSTKYTT